MLLRIVWWGALVLAAFALATMGVLIVVRAVRQRRARRRAERARVLRAWLVRWITQGDSAGGPDLDSDDAEILMGQARRLLHSLRGGEVERIVDLVERCGAIATERRALARGDTRARYRAATNLTPFAAHRADVRTALQEALVTDSDGRVRLAAAQALQEAGTPPAVATVLAALEDRPDVPRKGLQELIRAIAPAQAEAIKSALDATGAPGRQVLLVDGLGHAGDLTAVPLLVTLVQGSPDLDVRAAAMRALAGLGHPGARPAVATGLADPAWEVRAQAAQAAARIGLTDLAGSLEGLLDDPQWWVRFRAAQALAGFGDAGRATLRTAARGPGERARVVRLVLAEAEQ